MTFATPMGYGGVCNKEQNCSHVSCGQLTEASRLVGLGIAELPSISLLLCPFGDVV